MIDEFELVTTPTTVDHVEIGAHFERFDGRRYIANAVKMAHFPDDDAAVLSLLK